MPRTEPELELELDAFGIANDSIVGIGPYLRQRLVDHGIASAADIIDVHIDSGTLEEGPYVWFKTRTSTRCHVPGIGLEKAEAVRLWRKKTLDWVQARAAAKDRFLHYQEETIDDINFEMSRTVQAFETAHRARLDDIRSRQSTTMHNSLDLVMRRKAEIETRGLEVNGRMSDEFRRAAAFSKLGFRQFLKHVLIPEDK